MSNIVTNKINGNLVVVNDVCIGATENPTDSMLYVNGNITVDGNISFSTRLEVGDELLKAEVEGNTVIVSAGLKLGRNDPGITTEKLYNHKDKIL